MGSGCMGSSGYIIWKHSSDSMSNSKEVSKIGRHQITTGEGGTARTGVSLACFCYIGNWIGITLEIEDSQ